MNHWCRNGQVAADAFARPVDGAPVAPSLAATNCARASNACGKRKTGSPRMSPAEFFSLKIKLAFAPGTGKCPQSSRREAQSLNLMISIGLAGLAQAKRKSFLNPWRRNSYATPGGGIGTGIKLLFFCFCVSGSVTGFTGNASRFREKFIPPAYYFCPSRQIIHSIKKPSCLRGSPRLPIGCLSAIAPGAAADWALNVPCAL